MRLMVRAALVLAAITLLNLPDAQAQTPRPWNVNTGGNWTTPANWAGGNVPDASNEIAVFSNTGLSASKTVTLDASITVNAIQITATQSNPLTIQPAAAQTLTFYDTGGGPFTPITVASYSSPVTHTISANIIYDGSAATRLASVGSNATLNLTGTITSSTGSSADYAVSGGGGLTLSGNNSGFDHPISVTGGGTTLTVNGSLGSPVTVGPGSSLTGSGT